MPPGNERITLSTVLSLAAGADDNRLQQTAASLNRFRDFVDGRGSQCPHALRRDLDVAERDHSHGRAARLEQDRVRDFLLGRQGTGLLCRRRHADGLAAMLASLHRGTREQTRTNSPSFPPVFWGNSRPVRVRELGKTGVRAALKPVFTGLSWWALQGLNLRPLPCEGNALPLS